MHTLQVFFIMAKIPYIKPAKSYIDQLSHLKQMGLIVKDDKRALKYLEAQFIKLKQLSMRIILEREIPTFSATAFQCLIFCFIPSTIFAASSFLYQNILLYQLPHQN